MKLSEFRRQFTLSASALQDAAPHDVSRPKLSSLPRSKRDLSMVIVHSSLESLQGALESKAMPREWVDSLAKAGWPIDTVMVSINRDRDVFQSKLIIDVVLGVIDGTGMLSEYHCPASIDDNRMLPNVIAFPLPMFVAVDNQHALVQEGSTGEMRINEIG
jgi:hypothetical protein